MTGAKEIHKQVTGLLRLVWFQRSLRLGLRALWLAGCGYLLGWSINALSGWLPDPLTWLVVGAAFAIPVAIGWVISRPRLGRFTWALDRRLGLHEQVSTAWMVCQQDQVSPLEQALIQDVLAFLPEVRKRILRKGWYLTRDLISLAVAALLIACIELSVRDQQSASLAKNIPLQPLPAAVEAPRSEQVFPQGVLGLEPQAPGSQGVAAGQGGAPISAADAAVLQSAMTQMGNYLGMNTATYELGQALQNMDLQAAASELENLADNADQLSNATKQDLANTLQSVSEAIPPGVSETQQKLADDLSQVADTLQQQASATESGQGQAAQPTPGPAQGGQQQLSQLAQSAQAQGGEGQPSPLGDQLGEVAADLRQLDQEMGGASGWGASSGAGSGNPLGERSASEPAARLQGSGAPLQLDVTSPTLSGLLNPQPVEQSGEALASGSASAVQTGSENLIQSYIIPYYYLWIWRNVVLAYFQP